MGADALDGDAVPVASPVVVLQQQLNRFAGAGVPADIAFLKAPLPVTGVLDPETAITAVLVVQKRAADAFRTYRDVTSTDILARANEGFADPPAWVGQNLADVTLVVSNYANARGLPGASGSTKILGLPRAVVIAAGLAAGALLFLRR